MAMMDSPRNGFARPAMNRPDFSTEMKLTQGRERMAEKDLWRWNGGGALVSWSYVPMARGDGGLVPLNLEGPEVRRVWLRGLLTRLPVLLGDFAYAMDSRVAAWLAGEGACAIDWRTKDGPATLLDFVGRTDAVHEVYTHLALTCLDRNMEPFEIEWGAGLFVSFALTDSGALNTAMKVPVDLRLALYADPYAPDSRGPMKDRASSRSGSFARRISAS